MKRAHSKTTSHESGAHESAGNRSVVRANRNVKTAGIVHRISMENFLCHDKLEIDFNEKINFIIGKNGSGKSAVLTGLQVALGERASSTSRGNKTTDFIKTGRPQAKVRVTLTNCGPEAFMPEVYGDFLSVERTINAAGGGGYKLFNERGHVISTKKGELDRILAKMNLQVDNPVCILTQEVAKNFLHGNDSHGKYKLFERATQMDVMSAMYSYGDEEIQRSKSCLKEKMASLELQKLEMNRWKAKKEWYDALDAVHDKKEELQNMIGWAQVEISEKESETALAKLEHVQAEIERLQTGKVDCQTKLNQMEENYRTRTEDATGKAAQIRELNAVKNELERKYDLLTNKRNQAHIEVKNFDKEKLRLERDKRACETAIEERKQANGDSEWARRNQARLQALAELKEKEDELQSQKKMSEHQVEQIRGALNQLKNEGMGARSETARLQRDLDTKTRALNELRRADAGSQAVFGDWVPELLRKIECTNFSGPKPKGPLGAYIKLRDTKWAPVVESVLGQNLFSFICANDSDTKVLNRLLEEVMGRNAGHKPKITAARMTGQMFDVSNNKVQCEHLNEKGIFCLMDMLIIEDADVANMLIDMANIEQLLLIQEDRDARHFLSDVNRVPYNCKRAITREGNMYYPDPNYKTYSGRVQRSARYLQASVEDAIRNMEYEINVVRQELERASRSNQGFLQQLRQNEEQLRSEESRLEKTRRDLYSLVQRKQALEAQAEPEPTDVAALEEDVLDLVNKLEVIKTDQEAKEAYFKQVCQELKEAKAAKIEQERAVAELIAEADPLKNSLKSLESKQNEIKSTIKKIDDRLVSFQVNLRELEKQHHTAKEKVESDTKKAEALAPRMQVTKSLKSLNSELKQITEQVAAQEREFGSRESVLAEYAKRIKDMDRSRSEVHNVQISTRKLIDMSKRRKRFLKKFRLSIEMRTHHVFQSMLKLRNFEGAIDFNEEEKSLTLMVTPPGRDDASQPTPAKKKNGKGGTDIRSLSGGERSFATVCFILSLWDAIESPIRVLDEFDVFMDHVNRALSMDLLLNEARSSVGRQFIFLTPLGLQQDKIEDDMSIFKMADPDRRDEAPQQ